MELDTEQDPFVSITKLCQPTASQEAKFPNCPLARESENFADSNSDQFSSSPDPTPSDPTGIVMVSPPGSIGSARQQAEDDAVFHTPPEHNLPSYFSAEDQNLDELSSDGVRTIDVRDRPSDRPKNVRVFEECSEDELESKKIRVPTEELGGETIPADETEAIIDEFEGSGGAHDEDEDVILDSTVSAEKMAASNLADDCSVDMMNVGVIDVVHKNCELSKDGIATVNGIDGNHVKSKEEIVKLKCNLGNGCTEMRHESSIGGSEKVNVVKDGMIPSNGNLKTAANIIEKIDEFRYVGGGDSQKSWKKTTAKAAGGFGRRRQLPESLEGKGKNVSETLKPKSVLFDFLDVLKVAVGDANARCEDVDFLGTAKMRGLTFPQPRWWSAEGEDE
ncbi:hypothetical protein OROGR_026761 [Orobanche gracilis]